MTKEDLIWLAGYLEGEGSFILVQNKYARITFASTDEDIATRVCDIFQSNLQGPTQRMGRKPIWRGQVNGKKAIVLMLMLKPYLGVRRGKAVDKAVSAYKPRQQRSAEKFESMILGALTFSAECDTL